MGIFAIEIFLLDFLLPEEKGLLRFQRRHNNFSGVIDTAEIVSAVSLTPLKFGKKNSVVNVPMKFFTLRSQ
jgi:hypothetical protein